MNEKENKRLCDVCLKRKAGELNMCGKCRDMDWAVLDLTKDRPKRAVEYLEKKFKQASKKLKNRYMDRNVGE